MTRRTVIALVNAATNGALLGLTAWSADGHYDQPHLWQVGIFGAGLVAWLTAYAVALTIDPKEPKP